MTLLLLLLLLALGYPCNRRRSLFNMPPARLLFLLFVYFFFYFCIRICGHLVDILLARLLWAKTARKKQSTHTRTEFLAVWEKSFSFLPQHLCFYSFAVRWRFKFSPAC